MKYLRVEIAAMLPLLSCWSAPILAETSLWAGQWVLEQGLMTLNVAGSDLKGTYGDGGTIAGTIANSSESKTRPLSLVSRKDPFSIIVIRTIESVQFQID